MLALPTLAATAFSGPAPMVAPRLAGASSVSMRAEGEIGVTPPLGVYDPLGLIDKRVAELPLSPPNLLEVIDGD